jgi:hypothetical protein
VTPIPILRPRQKPKHAYPNSDRYGEDGRRIYSAYAANPSRRLRRLLPTGTATWIIAIAVLALVAFAFGYFV